MSQPLPAQHTRHAIWLLCGFVLAVFGMSVSFDFVNWDDPWYVLRNPLIKEWSFQNLWGIATETVTRNFAPLTIFSYLIDHTFWGTWAGGYHLTNVLLHAVNAVLVFLLVRQVTSRHVFALVVALLFAVHPIQIESVVWISARKGLLSSTFMLLSLLNWLKRERTSRDELYGLLFFLLALFCKASAVVVPGIVLVYDYCVRNRKLTEALAGQFIGGLIAIWFVLLTAGAQQSQTGGVRHHLSLSKLEILGIDAVLLWKYLGMLFWPGRQAILYDPPIEGVGLLVLLSLVGWAVVAAVLWRLRKRSPLLIFAALTSLGLMIPVLNLFPLTTLMNDRYLYLPSVPLFAIAVGGIEQIARRVAGKWERTREANLFPLAAVASGFAVLIYAGTTINKLPDWQDDLTLWKQAAEVSPELPVVQYQYALAEWREGQKRSAINRMERALTLARVDKLDRERFKEQLAAMRSSLNETALHTK